jgi:hypothetical protein
MPILKYVYILLVAALLVACARDKEPAEVAIKAAGQAIEQVRGEAALYAPEKLKELDDALKAAQDNFAKKEYKAALDGASGLAAKAQDVAKAAAAKKAELTKSWEDMTAGIPQMMDAVKSRLDILAKSKKLPAGLDKDKLAALNAGYDEAMKQFQEAKDAASSGNLSKAIEAGNAIKQKGMEIATTLGLKAQ